MLIPSLRNIMIVDMTYHILVREFSTKQKKSEGPYKTDSPCKVVGVILTWAL